MAIIKRPTFSVQKVSV